MTSKHTHALRNEFTLVWGSLRLAPIIEIYMQLQLPFQHSDLVWLDCLPGCACMSGIGVETYSGQVYCLVFKTDIPLQLVKTTPLF